MRTLLSPFPVLAVLLALLTLAPRPVLAQAPAPVLPSAPATVLNAAPTPVASDITRNCSPNGGCVLTCLNMAAETVLTENASRAVRIISLSNGNSEFRMDNGAAGINVVLVSHDNLMCRLTGGI